MNVLYVKFSLYIKKYNIMSVLLIYILFMFILHFSYEIKYYITLFIFYIIITSINIQRETGI